MIFLCIQGQSRISIITIKTSLDKFNQPKNIFEEYGLCNYEYHEKKLIIKMETYLIFILIHCTNQAFSQINVFSSLLLTSLFSISFALINFTLNILTRTSYWLIDQWFLTSNLKISLIRKYDRVPNMLITLPYYSLHIAASVLLNYSYEKWFWRESKAKTNYCNIHLFYCQEIELFIYIVFSNTTSLYKILCETLNQVRWYYYFWFYYHWR